MDGPDHFHDSVFELSTMLLGAQPMHEVLQRVVDLTVAAVPGCAHCGVSLLTDGRAATAAATDGTTLQLDGSQYTNGEGPCLQAARTGEVVHIQDMVNDNRFPSFATDATRLGILSSISFPLLVGEMSIGALNLYGRELDAFDESSRHLALRFARQAAATLANAEIHERTVTLITQLNEAMGSRSVIDQARGIIMAATGCSAQEALDSLREQSQHENRKVRDIASELVSNTQRK